MTFNVFTHELGSLIKEAREAQDMTLQALSWKTGIVSDQIQKIESAKHGGILIGTYVKLVTGLKVSLSFTHSTLIKKKIVPVNVELLDFLNDLFLGLSSLAEEQFLNLKPTLLLKYIGELVLQKRKSLELTQKQLATLSNISNTTLVQIENGEQNFRLSTLHKIAIALKEQ